MKAVGVLVLCVLARVHGEVLWDRLHPQDGRLTSIGSDEFETEEVAASTNPRVTTARKLLVGALKHLSQDLKQSRRRIVTKLKSLEKLKLDLEHINALDVFVNISLNTINSARADVAALSDRLTSFGSDGFKTEEGPTSTSPRLGFRPMPPDNAESSLVRIKTTDQQNLNTWISKIDEFLRPYKNLSVGGNVVQCDYRNPPPEGKVCFVDIEEFEPCTSQYNYSYPSGKPCIFLELNKIYNWVPQYYDAWKKLPKKMPQDLKNHIVSESASSPNSDETVWVSCEGETPADKENVGFIHYFPKWGFPGYFFPYKNQEGYLNPVIAVWFENPTPGVLINIECKLWAKNILHERTERRGSVHFELMVD